MTCGPARARAMSALFGGNPGPGPRWAPILRSYPGNVSQLEKAGRDGSSDRTGRGSPCCPARRTAAVIDIDFHAEERRNAVLRGTQAGRQVRPHEDGEIAAVRGLNALAEGGQHAAVGTGDRRDPAARRPNAAIRRGAASLAAPRDGTAGMRLHPATIIGQDGRGFITKGEAGE